MILYAIKYRAFSHVERFGIGVIIHCFDYEDIPMLDNDANRTLVHQLQEGGLSDDYPWHPESFVDGILLTS